MDPVGSQNASALRFTSLAHFIEHIRLRQLANVSEANIPTRLPAVTTPVMTLQACLDDTVSGVSFPRNKMLDVLSYINGIIHKMNREQALIHLAQFNLDPRGTLLEMRKRLKSHYKRQRITNYHNMLPYSERMQFEYLVAIDFQATCDKYSANFVQEIIEFSAVFVNVRDKTIRHVFRNFCKPIVNPVLTSFCTYVTGITQAQVDYAMDITEVLRAFQGWLFMLNLGPIYKFAILTDGSWDMAELFKNQLELSGIDLPSWAEQWVNIRKVCSAFYGSDEASLQGLSKSVMGFRIGCHSGLDNAMNMASLAVKLVHDGCIFTFNEHFCYASNVRLSRPLEPLNTNPSFDSEAKGEGLSRPSEPLNTNPSSDSEAPGEGLSRPSEPLNTNPSFDSEAKGEGLSRPSEPLNTNPSFDSEAKGEGLSRPSEPLNTNPSFDSEAKGEGLSRPSEPLNTNPSSDSEAKGEGLSRPSEPLNTNPSSDSEAKDEGLSRPSEPLNTNPSSDSEAQDEGLSRPSEPLNTNPSSDSKEAQGENLSRPSEPLNTNPSSACNEAQGESHKNQESKIDMMVLLLDSLSIFVVMLLMFFFQGHLNP